MFKPKDVYKVFKSKSISTLIRNDNDMFWVFSVDEYSNILKDRINTAKRIKDVHRPYLTGVVDYMNGLITEAELKSLYESMMNKKMTVKVLNSEFGELISPILAVKFLKSKNVDCINNIVFPVRENYEVYDFFIKNECHHGFSVKAAVGATNTLSSGLIYERIKNMEDDVDFKGYEKELIVLKNLGKYKMFQGVLIAFEQILRENVMNKNFGAETNNLKKIFSTVDLIRDAKIIENNRKKKLKELNLSDTDAYNRFLNEYIITSGLKNITAEDIKKYKSGELDYTATNLVYGLIDFISKVDFDFDYIMEQAFQNLNIIKVSFTKGVPKLRIENTIRAEKMATSTNYVYRNKSSFKQVKHKLGVQL